MPDSALKSLGINESNSGAAIGGHWRKGAAVPGDFRAMSPRFQDGNVDANLALVETLRRVAEGKGGSVAQIAIAWVAAQGGDIVPLIGARRRDRLAADPRIDLGEVVVEQELHAEAP